VSGVIRPRSAIRFTAAYDRPGMKGADSSRICHGPIWFCVACRDSGSNSPPHDEHWLAPADCDCPQYGHGNHVAPPVPATPPCVAPGVGVETEGWAASGAAPAASLPSCAVAGVVPPGVSWGSLCIEPIIPPLARTSSARTPRAVRPGHGSHPYTPPMTRLPRAGLLAAIAATAACQSDPPRRAERSPSDEPLAARVLRQDAEGAPRRLGRVSPPATLNGATIAWDALHDAMVEAAGAVALEETALDRLLAREAERRGIDINEDELDAEERALARSIGAVADSDAERDRLVRELRDRRGLGPRRYEALLRRTATLRALVVPNVTIDEGTLELARAVRFGEKRRVRVITTATLLEAQTAIRRLERGEPFAEVAARLSTDASAARGGLIEPLSLADPSYPAALRDALRELEPGDRTNPVALEGAFAVARLEEILPPDDEGARAAQGILEEEARAEQERILMTRLANRLLDGAALNILDPALERAWRLRRGR